MSENKASKKKDPHQEEFVAMATKHISVSATEEVMLLRSQLLTEYYINSILVYLLPPDEGHRYSSDGVRFVEKMAKLEQLKALSSSRIEAIRRLNRLRNKFGHDIEYKVSESDLDYLGFCFGKDYLKEKYEIDENGKQKSKKELLHLLLLDICVITAVKLASLLQEKK